MLLILKEKQKGINKGLGNGERGLLSILFFVPFSQKFLPVTLGLY